MQEDSEEDSLAGYPWSDEEDYWSDEDDDWCHIVDLGPSPPKRARIEDDPIQEGGAVPLFDFKLQQTQLPRRWRNTVQKNRYSAKLTQRRDADEDDNLGYEITSAVHRDLNQSLETHNLQPRDRVHFTLQAEAFGAANNHCFQSTQFAAEEVANNTPRFNTYLHQLARQLNSNQSFSPGDDFAMELTTIHMPQAASGHGKKRDPMKSLARNTLKRSRIVIKNKDDLCCARAIVTTEAWADEKAQTTPEVSYQTLRRGHKKQETLAKTLHRDANVDEGPCSLQAVAKFQAFLPSYQIKVLQLGPPHMIVYAGPPVQDNKRILLIQDGTHFDGCTSYGAFLNKSYFCHDCDHRYNHESIRDHRCNKQLCGSCLCLDCDDFLEAKQHLPEGQFTKPDVDYNICNRKFHAQRCLTKHMQPSSTPPNKSTCDTVKTCPDCCKTYELEFNKKGRIKGRRHKYHPTY